MGTTNLVLSLAARTSTIGVHQYQYDSEVTSVLANFTIFRQTRPICECSPDSDGRFGLVESVAHVWNLEVP